MLKSTKNEKLLLRSIEIFIFVLFFASVFVHIRYRINPLFCYFWQKPVFFLDFSFFTPYLTYPGGLVEYADELITQLFYYQWLGALIITLMIAFITLLTRIFLKKFCHNNMLYYFPALFLIALHSTYAYEMSKTASLFLTLFVVIIYIKLPVSKTLDIFIFPFLTIILYYFVAATFFLFVLLGTIYNVAKRRYYLSTLFAIIISLVLHYLGTLVFYAFDVVTAYSFLLPFDRVYNLAFAPYALYLSFPILVAFCIPKFFTALFNRFYVLLIQIFLICTIFYAVFYFSFDKKAHDMLLIEQYAVNHEWDNILDKMQHDPVDHRLALFHLYRALYFKGQLLENVLSYPFRDRAIKCFMMSKEFAFTAALANSDFLMDLGHVNEAEHWAHEALSLHGATPEVLERLFQVNILKKNTTFASMCLIKLQKTFVGKDFVKNNLQLIDNPENIYQDPFMREIKQNMPQKDFPFFTYNFRVYLENLVAACPDNKAAFDYLMFEYLLSGRLPKMAEKIHLFKKFGYSHLPRHVEEACILYLMKIESKEPVIDDIPISNKTLARFKDYNTILAKYRGDSNAALNELFQHHGDTYWFYAMYIKKRLIEEKIKMDATEDIS